MIMIDKFNWNIIVDKLINMIDKSNWNIMIDKDY
jgi:hypothetical protein